MIRYALRCHDCHAQFEAWFASSAAYDRQSAGGLVVCPECDSADTGKQIMAPAIAGSRRTRAPEDAQAAKFAEFAAKTRRHIAENFAYVGADFAEKARAMHDGEADKSAIWGQASPAEARALAEEGVGALPLPEPFAPKPPPSEDDIN